MDAHERVIVIGAGPAGSVAARELARLGCRPVLLERAAFPRDKTCAGGLSERACTLLRAAGLWHAVGPRAYPIYAGLLIGPLGETVRVPTRRPACTLSRLDLDRILVEEAVRAGAELRENARVDSLVVRSGHAVGVRCGSQEVEADWIIAANGGGSRLNLHPRPPTLLVACMARFEGIAFEPHVNEFFFDPALVPHYGWVFPESRYRASVGIIVSEAVARRLNARRILEEFIDRRLARRLRRAEQVGPPKSHPIHTTARIVHDAAPGVLLAGEANRLVSGATGEGISYAMESGLLAARAVATAIRDDLSPRAAARRYQNALRRRLGVRLMLSGAFTRLGPVGLPWLMATALVLAHARGHGLRA